ncbi:hypothetical protein RIR_jg9973.t1 [Rhizophagus irregularis DAOM 181602=DAOM 197198]|uniref:Uncharacterized protein n=1 Tax=Rhizophagus irregularis (strain DAOM 181602 / DAOM 197198 / MUCL 43194) TaxID=747089 RepID=U9TKK4_RHIID|nr:hypothetical protein RIR_jg9973.t1 [Rhizophagus irregularis DAOM 181602=DAOM 197198]
MTTHASCLVVPRASTNQVVATDSERQRRKSVRFSRFEKVNTTTIQSSSSSSPSSPSSSPSFRYFYPTCNSQLNERF